MFRPSGTLQCNPKLEKIPLKLNEFEAVMYNHALVYKIVNYSQILLVYLEYKYCKIYCIVWILHNIAVIGALWWARLSIILKYCLSV